MKPNLLLIDECGTPGSLMALVAGAGYTCWQARGPLKVRTILSGQPIDAILWREGGANPHLATDLAKVWEKYPDIPVVHLYRDKAAQRDFSASSRLIESLPSASAQTDLLSILHRLLRGSADASDAASVAGSELAFRNIVSRMFRKPRPAHSAQRLNSGNDEFRAPNTALIPHERELLALRAREEGLSQREPGIRRRLRQLAEKVIRGAG